MRENGGRGDEEEHPPAPGPPSTNITVTFSFSNMGLWMPVRFRASAIVSTRLGAIAVLIRRVYGPDERVVVRAGA